MHSLKYLATSKTVPHWLFRWGTVTIRHQLQTAVKTVFDSYILNETSNKMSGLTIFRFPSTI